MSGNFVEKLVKLAGECGIEIDPEKAKLLGIFKDEIVEWNKRINLTAIVDEEQFIVKHIIDSLIILKKIDFHSGAKLVDVGTGAGFPGVPVKIMRQDLVVLLMDSSRKKTEFLKHAVKKLGLQRTDVLCARAEEAAKSGGYREMYDAAVARAVSGLNTLVELCLPLVKVGGIFIAMKGEDPGSEIEEALGAADILGGRIGNVIPYELPGGIKRHLIVVEKIKNTPEKFPRRPGMPQKKPIHLKISIEKEGD
ncbi:16S rRNA (guanine(527)-N(7))-methyltransferase RsmG [Thermosediminibacter oceani]|uniref:Ribosomal RNA small subunit methyltransferase G n=1 Tax=Thermosediminibacter oceani (strain ATCC BAA-1034 / DSM 16646 / JW/IW-1228P) TaxID=555079 RepID=D9S1A8_THEOJ|nr:16S rRNA (guanine(527)-N(7))-methyltransferase RsmG [Thermosediminibacter oceani]ADL08987.1 methyltransferase GidB [Thermosediminibacter oceani DSM 16646]